jgi:hypothetical protein
LIEPELEWDSYAGQSILFARHGEAYHTICCEGTPTDDMARYYEMIAREELLMALMKEAQ